MPSASYDQDFYQWSQETAQALLEGRFAGLDIEHIAEEIRDLGTSQKSEVVRRLAQIMAHMLKIRYQPHKHSRSWDQSITVQRIDLHDLLERNPSLATRDSLEESMVRAYRKAAALAVRDTDLPRETFPRQCPFTIDEVLPPEEPE